MPTDNGPGHGTGHGQSRDEPRDQILIGYWTATVCAAFGFMWACLAALVTRSPVWLVVAGLLVAVCAASIVAAVVRDVRGHNRRRPR